VLVDPEGLPGVYMARIVATLESNLSSSNAGDSTPLVVKKSPLEPVEILSSPRDEHAVKSDDSAFPSVTIRGSRKTGLGEGQPELPEGGLPATTTSPRSDLQAVSSSLPVENRIGNQVDTIQISKVQRKGK
jgi:hypothetical protein